jgi:hypothetical protein
LLNIVKWRKYSPVKFANFVYICITHGKNNHSFGSKMVIFPLIMQIYTIFAIFTGLYFLILQLFTTKLCNFTHFKMLFPAMVMVSFFLSWSKFRLLLESSIDSNLRFRIGHRIRTSDASIAFIMCLCSLCQSESMNYGIQLYF